MVIYLGLNIVHINTILKMIFEWYENGKLLLYYYQLQQNCN